MKSMLPSASSTLSSALTLTKMCIRDSLTTMALDMFVLLKLVIVVAFGLIDYWTITARALPICCLLYTSLDGNSMQ